MSPSKDRASTRNRLLSLMSAEDFDRLAPDLDLVHLQKGSVMVEADAPITHAFFPEDGIGSVVARSPEGLEAEAGLFGREGVAPTPLLMGAERAANKIIYQVEGHVWRMPKAPFLAAVEASAPLRGLLLRYVQTLVVQTSFTALSNAVHQIDERLARWILMCDDRTDGGEIPLTHEFMSLMLAVRRPSVTTTLHTLEGAGFISAERGAVTVRDRHALEQFAGDAYGKPEAVYRELIGPLA